MGTPRSDFLASVVVPVFNERGTVGEVVRRLQELPLRTEIIVVDDGSTDGTSEVLQSLSGIRVLTHAVNRGKGAAIRTALEHCTGDVVVIQDADLELDIEELPKVVAPVARGEATIVFGSRFTYGMPKEMPWPNKAINIILRQLVRVLYGAHLTDVATCYKAVPTEVLRALQLRCERFEFCPEVTAKVIRYGFQIVEVPLVGYRPRSVRDGKKIRWKDGVGAIQTLLYWRLRSLPPLPPHILSSALPQRTIQPSGARSPQAAKRVGGM
ncbi:MAG: glycosyltransferase family 2 protein [Candidatus Binatia bacterium]|nr:glycosyltransferase family 2 protein [Candidatus Binatia bacterium]